MPRETILISTFELSGIFFAAAKRIAERLKLNLLVAHCVSLLHSKYMPLLTEGKLPSISLSEI